MEIKIVISDTAGGGATPAPSVQVGGEQARPGAGGEASAATGQQQVSAPPEILAAAAAVGAIDAGPAPGTGGTVQPGIPPPFSASSGASDIETAMPSGGMSAGQSTAAQGGISPIETETPGEEGASE